MTTTINYTPELTASVIEAYKAGTPIAEIATTAGRSVKSIVAKLSREGVYKKKVYATKSGDPAVTKAALVGQIADILGVPAENVGSLETATKDVLKALVASLSK